MGILTRYDFYLHSVLISLKKINCVVKSLYGYDLFYLFNLVTLWCNERKVPLWTLFNLVTLWCNERKSVSVDSIQSGNSMV